MADRVGAADLDMPRVEIRSLRERAAAVFRNARAWYKGHFHWLPPEFRGADFRRFMGYVVETHRLATIVRALNPTDVAWRWYDQDMRDLESLIEDGRRWSTKKPYVDSGALSLLMRAQEVLEGAASRVRNPRASDVYTLASRMMYADDDRERFAARAVLADMLEELGFAGEANSIRQGLWRRDREILPLLGVPVPRARPTSGYDRQGRAS